MMKLTSAKAAAVASFHGSGVSRQRSMRQTKAGVARRRT